MSKICKINGVDVDVSYLDEVIKTLKEDDSNVGEVLQKLSVYTYNNIDLSAAALVKFTNKIRNERKVPEVFFGETKRDGDIRLSKNTPKCPTCGSTNIAPIGTAERAASVVGLGLFSKKINKTFKCKNCGHTW